ncbi:MAG: hypothetical protein VCD66_14640 [Alphaproteobacteria bacterium]
MIVTVDAGEDIDRRSAASGDDTGVGAMRYQYRAQLVFEEYGITPAYLVNFPVASQSNGYGPLLDFLQDGTCTIGARLHPLANPPFDEGTRRENATAGILPANLEGGKIARLTAAIEDNLGVRPLIYRAGPHDIGSDTARILIDLGYSIDASVFPQGDCPGHGGLDNRTNGAAPFWRDAEQRLIGLPLTAGYIGALHRQGDGVSGLIGREMAGNIFAKTGLLNHLPLSPEGVGIEQAMALTRNLSARGQRVFNLSYHGGSLEPGRTPHVKNDGELAQFRAWIEEYLAYFTEDLGGRGITPSEILAIAQPDTAHDDGRGQERGIAITGKVRNGIRQITSHQLTPHRHDDDSQILRMYYSLVAPGHDDAATLVLCRADSPLAASLGISGPGRAADGNVTIVGGHLFPHDGAETAAISLAGPPVKLAPSTVDTAIMHHLSPDHNAARGQSISRAELRQLVRDVYRWLRPGGNLIISFENIRAFGEITFWGYRRLLRSIGFGSFECFNILHEIDDPERLISFDPDNFDNFLENHHKSYSRKSSYIRNILFKLLIKTGCLKYLQNNFLIICQK